MFKLTHPGSGFLLACLVSLLATSFPLHADSDHPGFSGKPIVGHFTDQHLASIKSFTLPRLFLYDERGDLVPQKLWPRALKEVKKLAGDAYCCVSEKPAPAGSVGPPPDCKRIYYGENVHSNFTGLRDCTGNAIDYETLPVHKYLLVDYHADWCQPCVAGRTAIGAFFRSPASKGYVWVLIDMTRLATVQDAKRAHD